jgi:hypothetical protein
VFRIVSLAVRYAFSKFGGTPSFSPRKAFI